MNRLRLGLVGLGNWGDRLARSLRDIPGVELAWCFARSPEARTAFSAEHGCRPACSLDTLLSEPLDGVLVATPHSSHAELVNAIAGAGRHVMVEKPLALTTADATRCVETARSAGVVLHVAHYRRRLAATRRLRQVIDDGDLGTIHAVSGWFSRVWGPQTERPWRDDPIDAPLGAMTALGVHLVDNFHYLVGPIETVVCFSRHVGRTTAIDDMTTAMFEFEAGCLGQLGTSLRVPYGAVTSVFGSEGAAWSSDDGTRFLTQARLASSPVEHRVEPIDGVRANLEAFIDSIRSGTPPETGGREGLAVVAVMEAMQRSADDGGRPVKMSEVL